MGLIRSLFWLPVLIVLTISLFALAPLTALTGLDDVVPAGQDGWVSLFEGALVKGWEISDSSSWGLSDGLLRGSSGTILNRWCWVDFELQIKYRGEGRLLLRVGSDQTGHIGFEQPGYEFDLISGEFKAAPGEPLAKASSSRQRDKWNTLVVSASQGVFSFSSDEKQLLEVPDKSSPLKGRIGFVTGDGLDIQYVRVRPLDNSEKANIPAENYYCYVCHGNFEYDDPFVEVHEEAGVLCSECHGPSLDHRSDEDNVVPPDVLYRRPQVDFKCLECHERHGEEGSSAGEVIKNRVCTKCHEHRLLRGES